MCTAEKISTRPDWKITCPVGHLTTNAYVPWNKIYMRRACGHALISSPAQDIAPGMSGCTQRTNLLKCQKAPQGHSFWSVRVTQRSKLWWQGPSRRQGSLNIRVHPEDIISGCQGSLRGDSYWDVRVHSEDIVPGMWGCNVPLGMSGFFNSEDRVPWMPVHSDDMVPGMSGFKQMTSILWCQGPLRRQCPYMYGKCLRWANFTQYHHITFKI